MQTTHWNVDNTHSGVHFTVRHMVFTKVRGQFAKWNANLNIDAEDLTRSKVEVEIDIGSINTGVADRDAHLRSPDFFDAEKFPTMRFTSTRVEHVGGERYRFFGMLTIRDVSREVVLETEYSGLGRDPWGNERAAFTASASIDRRDFGLTWNQMLEAGGVLVGERVDIEIEVQAVKAAAAVAA